MSRNGRHAARVAGRQPDRVDRALPIEVRLASGMPTVPGVVTVPSISRGPRPSPPEGSERGVVPLGNVHARKVLPAENPRPEVALRLRCPRPERLAAVAVEGHRARAQGVHPHMRVPIDSRRPGPACIADLHRGCLPGNGSRISCHLGPKAAPRLRLGGFRGPCQPDAAKCAGVPTREHGRPTIQRRSR